MAEQATTTILQLVLINETGDSYYRMRWPGAHLAVQDPNLRVVNLDARAAERVQLSLGADLLVLYQSNDIDLLPLIAARKERGLKTLVEYNDNYYEPPIASPVAEEWASPLLWRSYEQLMEEADGVIVTGPGLKKVLSSHVNADFYELPNQLPQHPGKFETYWSARKDELVFGWGGSIGHISDFLAAAPRLVKLLEEIPNAVLHIMGNEALLEHIKVDKGRLRFTPWGSMNEYFEFLKRIHIGLVPLLDTPYNRCRSDVKALEIAGHGAVPVLPNALPYKSFLKASGIKPYSNLDEMLEQAVALAKDPKQMEASAKRCFDYVAENRVGPEHSERLELYRKFLPEKPTGAEWKVGPGYFEVQGTPQQQGVSQMIIAQAQQMLKQNQVPQGLDLLNRAFEKNPNNATLAISRIKYLNAVKDSSLLDTLSAEAKKHPDDLRFPMLQVAYSKDEKDIADAWDRVLSTLEKSPVPAQTFWERDVVRLFGRALLRESEPKGAADRLLNIYPNSAALHFSLAGYLERKGDVQGSLVHYSWLKTAKQQFIENEEVLREIKLSYLASWEEGLKNRGSKGKSTKKPRKKTAKKKTTKRKKKA